MRDLIKQKETKAAIYAYAEESLFTSKNAAGVIFNMKNNWAWKDQKDFVSDGKRITSVPIYDLSAEDPTES